GRSHRHRRAGALRAVPRVADHQDHPAGQGGRRRATRPLQPHARSRAGDRHPVHRPGQAADRPARAGRLVPPAVGDHQGQRDREHRHGPLLHDHRLAQRHLRGREPAAGDRAAHRHDAAQRHRQPHARGDADEPRPDQHPAAHGPRRGHGPLGNPRQPRRAEVDRPARDDPGGDGEADARRARPSRDDPPGRGHQGLADPHRRGREAVRGAQGRGREDRGDPARGGRVAGDRDGLRLDPRRPSRPGAPQLPVPADAPAARAGRGEQDLHHPERGHERAVEPVDAPVERRRQRRAAAGSARAV
ncbi:MAG: Protein QmcA (possibly involved in integral membrane quality control), partial [uncultured Solirubrobacteraceae bacterium]